MARIAPRATTPTQMSIAGLRPTAAPTQTRMLCTELVRWEGACQHLYVDTYGNVATAVGHRLPNADAAIALPWRHRGTGVAATPSEIRAAFAQVRAQGPGHKSITYRFASDLVLAAGVAVDLAAARVQRELLPGLRRLCPNFDRCPLPARRALVDMAYDLGLAGLAKFRNLIAACKRGDFATAAEHCHRRTTRGIRNLSTRNLLLEAADLTVSVNPPTTR
jgi:GH24 family phage-related lysozyme (muramidase)